MITHPDNSSSVQAADLVAGQRDQPGVTFTGSPCGFGGAGGDQERGGEHGQRDVGVPGVVAADLVLVQADLPLGGLERFLSAPPVVYLNRVLLSLLRQ